MDQITDRQHKLKMFKTAQAALLAMFVFASQSQGEVCKVGEQHSGPDYPFPIMSLNGIDAKWYPGEVSTRHKAVLRNRLSECEFISLSLTSRPKTWRNASKCVTVGQGVQG
jgi:hypothetical protein